MFFILFFDKLCLLLFPTCFFANIMKNSREEGSSCCCFHPKEVIVGICALCLRERLLDLAAKQGQHALPRESNRSFRGLRRRTTITFPKVFALGSLLLRHESRHQKPYADSDQGSIGSLEDSFISIKFGDNGQASWECKKHEMMGNSPKEITRGRSMIEHVKAKGMLKWQKRICRLLQVAHWKRSSKGGVSHVGMVGMVEGRRGWIRNLTKRKTTE